MQMKNRSLDTAFAVAVLLCLSSGAGVATYLLFSGRSPIPLPTFFDLLTIFIALAIILGDLRSVLAQLSASELNVKLWRYLGIWLLSAALLLSNHHKEQMLAGMGATLLLLACYQLTKNWKSPKLTQQA